MAEKSEEIEDIDAPVESDDEQAESEETTDEGTETEEESEESEEESAEEGEDENEPSDEDVYRMRLDLLTRDRDHYKAAHDKLTGQYGKLVARLKRLEKESGVEAEDDDEKDDVREQLASVREAQVVNLRNEVVNEFAAEHPDISEPETLNSVRSYLMSHPSPADEYVKRGDFSGARLAAKAHLTEAYLAVTRGRDQKRTAQAKHRNSKEAERFRREKRTAVPAGTGRSSPKPASRTTDPAKMTRDELIAHYKRMGRPGF